MPDRLGAMVGRTTNLQIIKLLEKALKLINLYATELNQKDGGSRKTYQTISEWFNDGNSN
jgi:hypothetical protein